eukprot:SAG31_NODE_2037_length_6604_cov_2.820600_7_plen_63_part_00
MSMNQVVTTGLQGCVHAWLFAAIVDPAAPFIREFSLKAIRIPLCAEAALLEGVSRWLPALQR